MSNTTAIAPETTMSELLQQFPGAQRALFARYHIGGCQSCGFSPTETLASVCERNENLPFDEVVTHIVNSHQDDAKIQISPDELATWMGDEPAPRLLDVRTREEFEAVKIPSAELFSQDMVQTIFTSWGKETRIVVYDHQGSRSMDAATYLIGHGYANTHCLTGGIDAYSQTIDTSLPRYRVEVED